MTDSAVATELVEVEEKKLVVTTGVGIDVVRGGLTHMPQLSSEMTIDERRDAIRGALKEAIALPDRLDVMTGELLYEVQENEYWKAWTIRDPATDELRPYASFKEYAEAELGLKKRKAYYLTQIYETFVVKLGLDKEILRNLEWSKAKEVVGIVTPENWAEILDKLPTMTVKQVQEMAKEMTPEKEDKKKKGKAGEAGEEGEDKEKFSKWSCSLSAEQLEVVQAALDLAKSMTGSDSPGNCLHLICTDFVSTATGGGLEGALGKLENILRHVSDAFHVKVSVEEVDSEVYAKIDSEKKE